MGIFKRATDIVRSNINSMLDSLEDPSKIAELTISDAKESYVKLKKDSTEVVAVAISTEKQYKAALQDASLDFTGDTGALDKFNRMEEKADKELAKAEAMEQMNANEHAEADSAADLMAKYSYGSGATDTSLDALKAEMGLGGADDSDADIEALKAELDK